MSERWDLREITNVGGVMDTTWVGSQLMIPIRQVHGSHRMSRDFMMLLGTVYDLKCVMSLEFSIWYFQTVVDPGSPKLWNVEPEIRWATPSLVHFEQMKKKIDFRVLCHFSVLRDQEKRRQSLKKDLLRNQLVLPLHVRHGTLQDAFSLMV